MIRLNLELPNLFKGVAFRTYWSKNFRISKTRTLELQVYRYGAQLIDCDVTLHFTGSDHAGPHFELGLLGFYFSISIPDNRHWDLINSRWE